jgi:hypothetical protein
MNKVWGALRELQEENKITLSDVFFSGG